MLTTDQIDAAALYDLMVTAFARGGLHGKGVTTLTRQLIETRCYNAQDRAALLAFLDASISFEME